ncbi:ankyrin repeat-containing domain protein [Aspergillus carlsbadensis]|nr:ankyrin repeat-containing domain protein [Aspergillus carlsbadensis]
MHIFDLPLEMFRAILAQTLPTRHKSHITQMQLVNSETSPPVVNLNGLLTQLEEIFAREVLGVLFTTRKWRLLQTWEPSAYSYLCYRALAPDAHVYYPVRTVRQTTDWIVAQLSAEDCRKEICRSLSCSAVSQRPRRHGRELLGDTLHDSSIERSALSDRKNGLDQDSNALVHRFSAAACIGDLALVQTLLDKGVDVNGRSDVFDTALVNAARWGHLPVVNLLLANGADLHRDVIHEVGRKIEDEFDEGIDFVSWFVRSPEQCHALEAAAIGGHEDIISLLLEPRLNLARSSCTFFHALIGAAGGGSIKALRMLLDTADFDAVDTRWKEQVLAQSLKKASIAGHLECMGLLIDAGASLDYNFEAEGQNPPLFFAAKAGQNKAIELLLERGADINLSRLARDHPLSAAAGSGYPRTVSLLLDRGAGFNSNGDHIALLLYRCRVQACALKVVLERGYHKQNPASATRGLEVAKREKRWDLVAIFRQHGVTVRKKTSG